jgi:hypothetical protein
MRVNRLFDYRSPKDSVNGIDGEDGVDGVDGISADVARLEANLLYDEALATCFKELEYTGDLLTTINLYEDSSKTNKLFTKVLSYTDSKLSSTTVTDERTGSTLSKAFTYSGEQLIEVNETYTEV